MNMLARRKFSMAFVLLYIVFSISIIGGVAIFVNQIIDKKLNYEMNQLINMNIELTSLKTYLSNNNLYLSSYFNSGEYEYYIEYRDNKEKIKELSSDIYKKIRLDEKSSMYYRILTNIFDYEEELSNQLLQTQNASIQTYEMQQDIKRVYSYIEQQSNYLTESCIQYQTKEYESINAKYHRIQSSIYIGLILIIIGNYLYITGLVTNIISNLSIFCKAASNLAEGNWYIEDINKQNCSELNVFALAFNTMKNNIQEYITQLELKAQLEKDLYEQQLKNVEMDQLLKESQLLSLQSQMNPHFLFNTLNIISRTAMFEGNDKIVKLMESMAKILRYNLINITNMVTLQEEVDIVKAYLYIQTARFQDQMNFSIEMGNIDLDNIYVPPMIIQPIVENCIKHGFKNKEEGGEIIISVIEKNSNIIISVEDNGEGITPEELESIFKEKRERCSDKCEVGLKNVKKRLELNFGEENLLRIESIYGHGTTAIITIPIEGESRCD